MHPGASVCGLQVGVAVGGTLQDLRGRRDLGFGRLQDRVLARPRPGRERRAEITVVRVLGRDHQALPVRERGGKRPVGGGQVLDPRGHLTGRLPGGQGELVALSVGGGLGLGGPQRRVVLGGVAAAQFGVGSDRHMPLLHGGIVPVGPVGHGGGEHVLTLPVGRMQGLVAACQCLFAGSFVVVAALAGGVGFGASAQAC